MRMDVEDEDGKDDGAGEACLSKARAFQVWQSEVFAAEADGWLSEDDDDDDDEGTEEIDGIVDVAAAAAVAVAAV